MSRCILKKLYIYETRPSRKYPHMKENYPLTFILHSNILYINKNIYQQIIHL